MTTNTMTTNTLGGDGASGGPGVRRWWNRRAFSRAENTDSALMVGALSIVSFWAPGFGVVLGILAVVAALWADRSPMLSGPRAPRGDVALAYGAGILGVVLGIGFLAIVLPNW
ncbi:hypothetical protein [Rhodococcus sp. 14-2470-1b]|uniref:hypothetical protein n=1 Tax=Rhodococcus sp. 14-2470-1b TaxID=2023149 RepID=UPI0020CE96A1|nr:hypothetical protein [Rhodococcus sp. 14-2470-1b]